jgi:hypothetical protein
MDLLKKSSIVFTGTVKRSGAVSFASVPKSPRTVVMEVESVSAKPAAVSLKRGDLVTVETRTAGALREGMRATIYAEGWILGEGVAVREIGHEVVPATGTLAEREKLMMGAQATLRDEELKQRLEAADLVVVGRVVSVRTAPVVLTAGQREPVTEHAPNWQEAVVRVESTIKGTAAADQQVVLRFPGSMDVAWYGTPRFKEGQEGTFILQKDQISGVPKPLVAGVQTDAFFAARTSDVLSKQEAVRVRTLMKK